MKRISILMIMCMTGVQVQAELLAGTATNASFAGRVAIGEYGLGTAYPIMQARPFTTGSAPCNLTSIYFGSHLYLAEGSGNLNVSVYTDSGNLPGSAVAGGMNLFSANAGSVDSMIIATSTVTLEAGQTYWFVASADQSAAATRYWWELTDTAALNPGGNGEFGLPLSNANDAFGWTEYTGSSMQMQVFGEAVPEPGSLTLMGVGAGGAWLARRKRRRHLRTPEFEELEYQLSFLEEERTGSFLGNS